MAILEIFVIGLAACLVGYFMGTMVVRAYYADKKKDEENKALKEEINSIRKRIVDKTKYIRCKDCRFNYSEPTELEQRHCDKCIDASNWELM